MMPLWLLLVPLPEMLPVALLPLLAETSPDIALVAPLRSLSYLLRVVALVALLAIKVVAA